MGTDAILFNQINNKAVPLEILKALNVSTKWKLEMENENGSELYFICNCCVDIEWPGINECCPFTINNNNSLPFGNGNEYSLAHFYLALGKQISWDIN